MKNTEKTKTEKSVKRGRPVNPNSARQARVTKWNSMRAKGLEVKRGRPMKPILLQEIEITPEIAVVDFSK